MKLSLLGAAVVMLVAGPLGWAQSQAAKPGPSPARLFAHTAPVSASAEANAKGGLTTGIKVHGHWVLEVKNPDGKVVSHTEFENSLITGGNGDTLLTQILAGNATLGAWAIFLSNGNATGPCSTGTSQGCSIMPANATALDQQQGCSTILGPASPQPSCYATLTETVGGTADNRLILSGSAYVDTSTQISSLETGIITCGALQTSSVTFSTVAPSACLSTVTLSTGTSPANADTFTAVNLPQTSSGQCGGANQPPCAVNVTPGQTVAVVVTLSFQ